MQTARDIADCIVYFLPTVFCWTLAYFMVAYERVPGAGADAGAILAFVGLVAIFREDGRRYHGRQDR